MKEILEGYDKLEHYEGDYYLESDVKKMLIRAAEIGIERGYEVGVHGGDTKVALKELKKEL